MSRELFSPEFRRTTIVTTIMFACSYGVAFGAIQQIAADRAGARYGARESGEGDRGQAGAEAKVAAARATQEIVANYTKAQETGGLFGRFALAMLVAHVASRQRLLRMFLIPGIVVLPLVFWAFSRGHEMVFVSFDMSWLPGFHQVSITLLGLGIFLAGFLHGGPVQLLGQLLAARVSRCICAARARALRRTSAAGCSARRSPIVTQQLAVLAMIPGATPSAKTALVAAGVAFALYLINLILSFLLPEPQQGAIAE